MGRLSQVFQPVTHSLKFLHTFTSYTCKTQHNIKYTTINREKDPASLWYLNCVLTDRPVHAGTQILAGAVGCRRQGWLGWSEVLEAWAGDRFPKAKQELLLTVIQKFWWSKYSIKWSRHRDRRNQSHCRLQYKLVCSLFIHVLSGFSWRYLVEESWEQLGEETASSTLGWRERDRDRSVLSVDESAVISLSPFSVSDSRPIILTHFLRYIFVYSLLSVSTTVPIIIISSSINRLHFLHWFAYMCGLRLHHVSKCQKGGFDVTANVGRSEPASQTQVRSVVIWCS